MMLANDRQPRVQALDDEARYARYTRVAIILHWAIAFFIVFNLSVGFFMEGWPPPIKMIVVSLHASAGMTVLALTVARVIWRLLNEPPPYPAEMKPWERHTAHFAHFLLYAAMVLMPLTGWAILSAHPPAGSPGFTVDMARKAKSIPAPPGGWPGGKPPAMPKGGFKGGQKIWGVIPFPAIAPLAKVGEQPEGLKAQDELHEDFVNYHALGGYLLLALLALHIVGALKHQFMDRQPELQRMGIGRFRRT